MPNLSDLLKENKPIYVLNRTGRFLPKQSPYILEIRHEGKQAKQVIIPATKFPFHLSAHVPAALLAEATELYGAITRGILELVDPDDARKIMKDPIAQKAVDNAMRKFQPIKREEVTPPELKAGRRPPGTDRGISEVDSDVVNGDSMVNPALRVADVDDPENDINFTVIQILKDLDSDPSLRDEKFLELVALEDLTEDDYGYVLLNCEVVKIKAWARNELAQIVGTERAAEIEAEQEEADLVASGGEETKRKKRRRKHR